MKLFIISSLILLSSFISTTFAAGNSAVDLVNFDGKTKKTSWTFRVLNDPVMGGQSSSTWKIENQTAVWIGETKIVPSLKAPGFCNAETTDGIGILRKANDASEYTHLLLRVRSFIPYDGFKVSFAADTINPQFKSFKSEFNVTRNDGVWHTVAVPFDNFSNDWSQFTGRCDTKDPTGKIHKCCSKENPEVCPSLKNLKDITHFGLWTEGVAGKFHLEVKWIRAGYGAGGCSQTEYCCPDAKHCLTPTKVSCKDDASVCSSDQVCCPLTKLCVNVGQACDTPCKDQGTYCCPITKSCLTPVSPGDICRSTSDCKSGEVCCPLTNLCITIGDVCDPGVPTPEFMRIDTTSYLRGDLDNNNNNSKEKDDDKPCCEGQCPEGTEKYHSIAASMKGFPHCGECCINPKSYSIFHIFEPNLTKSPNNNPCKFYGYPNYNSTVTHGVWPLRVTLDLYDH